MIVRRILNEKGREVVTARSELSLGEIVRLLSEQRIGAVVICDDGRLRGIISERDIVRALARDGRDVLDRSVNEVMTRKVTTCTPEDTIDQVMQKMTAGRFRHVPVLENGELGGLISIGDVVKARIEEVQREAEQIREYIATA
jgi:CBS domain-containing protein